MNHKLLLPSYRTRFLFIRDAIAEFSDGHFTQGVNLGSGEGDYDHLIANKCENLISCDINEQDVKFAQLLNSDLKNVDYLVENALNLSFADESFDLLVSVDILEHVGQPEIMMSEVSRILGNKALAFITFPQLNFPATYDPINWVRRIFGTKNYSIGAYAYGHDYLIDRQEFLRWAQENELDVLAETNLSGSLVGLLEMYWPSLVQKLVKPNSSNADVAPQSSFTLRPSLAEPKLIFITDFIIWLDRALFGRTKKSIGKGFVLRRK